MINDINKIIEKRRVELNLRDLLVAEKIGLNIDWYCDIEWHEDELESTVSLEIVKKLFDILQLDFFTMAEIECHFCVLKNEYLADFELPRNELIKRKRTALNMTRLELGDKVNFYEIEIENMERDADLLEGWVIEDIMLLAQTLELPPQILLDVKCKNCHR